MLAKTAWVLVVAIILIVLSYFYLDKPLVFFLAVRHSRDLAWLKWCANVIPAIVTALVFIYYLYYGVSLAISRLKTSDHQLILVCHAVVTAVFFKLMLKQVFGRYWTATFICNNPSLIRDHKYGFNWFHGNVMAQSFPSGHATIIAAFATSLWLLYPRYRLIWALLALLVAIGQIGMYYHFVSDVIGGLTLGGIVAAYIVTASHRSGNSKASYTP
ncbi:MAG: phosphatase PAP2 family protein [Coxiellaceae bacterium]|nr:phosphatase PAP2 family protein [Coxiellaceae bacterium]